MAHCFLSTCSKPPKLRMLETGKILLDSCDDVFFVFYVYFVGVSTSVPSADKGYRQWRWSPVFSKDIYDKGSMVQRMILSTKIPQTPPARILPFLYLGSKYCMKALYMLLSPKSKRFLCICFFNFGNVAVSAKKQVNELTEMWIPL